MCDWIDGRDLLQMRNSFKVHSNSSSAEKRSSSFPTQSDYPLFKHSIVLEAVVLEEKCYSALLKSCFL